jgi:hypothetical protein
MPGNQESFRDLVESRAAEVGVAPRKLYGWALDAIKQNMLVPILPEGVSIDTEFDHGGMQRQTWRQVIGRALAAIKHHIPSNDGWANTLMLDPAAFDKWLAEDSPAGTALAQPPLPSRRRPPDHRVRQIIQEYRESERAKGLGTSIPRMWKCVHEAVPGATRDQAIKVFQAVEGGPKPRGRPRGTRTQSK